MTATLTIADDLLSAITEGMNEMIPNAETPEEPPKDAPKAKTEKPKAVSRKGATKPAVQEEPAKEEPKGPPMVDGFALKDGADLSFLSEATVAAVDAIEAIGRKDKDLLSQYLALGLFQSSVAGMFASTKVYGQYVAAKVPASASLDPALRSNCKWLYQALNEADNDAADILSVLGVNRLEDFKSANPTVIRREYKAAKEAKEAQAKAEAEGKSIEEMEKEEAAEKAEADKEARANAEMVFSEFVAFMGDNVKTKKVMQGILLPVLKLAAGGKKEGAEVLALMNSLLPKDKTDH